MGMRWALLLVVFLLPMAIPLSEGWAEDVGRDGTWVDWTAPNKVYVHQNETVGTYITLQNKAGENQAFTIAPLAIPAPLSTVGLPVTELLVPNHLKQIGFGIAAPANAIYQNLNVSFSITSDLDPEFNETVEIEVAVVPRSNLNFGVDDYARFTVDELVRTAVAVNISNNATLTDDVAFNLHTDSDWSWGWNMPDVNGTEAYIAMAPGTQSYVYLWIEVPAVVNGAPLAETGPRFVLSAVSGLDKDIQTWTFDLQMNSKKNASIDEFESSLSIAPNQDGRVKAVVRNVGNTANKLNITLQGLTANGEPLPGTVRADRFNASGWIVALFGGLENIVLEPNESRTIEIGFQAPNVFQGELSVELRVFAEGAASSLKTARIAAAINRISAGEITHESEGCLAILPNQSCTVDLNIMNTGNAYNTFVVREVNTTDGFQVNVPSSPRLLQVNQDGAYSNISISAPADALAFTIGETTFELLDDTGNVVGSTTINLKIAPQIEWTFKNVAEQVNAKGRLSIAMEVRNEGNAVDGLIVQLQSSHSVDMGFIPPDIAVYEDGIEYPRSFEVNEIPLNSNFTIRAWVQLPQDQTSNGTVYINTTIRSRFAPEIPFVHTSTGDYLGVAWQPTEEVENGIDWGGMAATAVSYVKAWAGVLFSVLLASIILYKAVLDRQRRLEASQLLPYQDTPQQAEDWMDQYRKEPTETAYPAEPPAPLNEVPKSTYEAMFRHQHGAPETARAVVEPGLVSAASLVLDRGTEEANKNKANEMLSTLQSEGVSAPLPSNQALTKQPAPSTQSRPSHVPNQRSVSSVPLPSNEDVNQPPVDDLEF